MHPNSGPYKSDPYGYQPGPPYGNGNSSRFPINPDQRPVFQSLPPGFQGQQYNPSHYQPTSSPHEQGQQPYSDMWENPPPPTPPILRAQSYQPHYGPSHLQQPASQPHAFPNNPHEAYRPLNIPQTPYILAQGRQSFPASGYPAGPQQFSQISQLSQITQLSTPPRSSDHLSTPQNSQQAFNPNVKIGPRLSEVSNNASQRMSYPNNSFSSIGSSSVDTAFASEPGRPRLAAFVRLEVKALSLRKKDLFGSSDPICFLQTPPSSTLVVDEHTKWTTIDKTEVQRNTLDPAWTRQFRLPYVFGESQPLRFWLVDIDNHRVAEHTPEEGDFLGMCTLKLADVVRNTNCSSPLMDRDGRAGNFGKLFVRVHDENTDGRVKLDLTISGEKLLNVERFGKSDPFFRLSYIPPGGGISCVLTTSETVRNNLNPQWKPTNAIIYTEGHLWNRLQLILSVLDQNRFEKHRSIGDCKVTLGDLLKRKSLNLTNMQKRSPRSAGTIKVNSVHVQELPSFTSYIQGGLRLDFSVAVDFSVSNKNVNSPESLHYMGDPNNPNVYVRALKAVGTVISSYLHDNTIVAYGFGAKLPGSNETSYEFSLSGADNPSVIGVDGLLTAYAFATRNVKLSQPTKFERVIRTTIDYCDENPVSQDNQYFKVLLIVTDGVISDMKETIDAIIDASYSSPLSIVIVGVGDKDFTKMRELDSDDKALTSLDGREAKYDIVQFVKFEDSMSLEMLAAEVLHEVPERLVKFMVDSNIKPKVASNGMSY